MPLCGKSRDMTWLAARGHHVVGVEFVEQACVAFFEEQAVPYEKRETPHPIYQGSGVALLCADIFDVTPDDVGEVTWIFDRAALVALPPDARLRYADHLMGFLPVGGSMLLSAIDYDPSKMSGPPFCVSPEEVERLFGGHHLERLSEEQVLDQNPRFRRRGLDWMSSHVWIVTKG